MRRYAALPIVAALLVSSAASASGPEIAMRELAGGQIKKGVRTIGMGGDGATTGNYGLVWRDAGGAIFDEGIARYGDTGNLFTFSAVGFTTPTFWDDAAFYVIALSQHATDVRVWDFTVKFAKPLSKRWSLGFMGAYELSQGTFLPDDGTPPIRYETSYLPSGGLGLHFQASDQWQVGARVILNHDTETRDDALGVRSGLNRSYEYRLGVAFEPWKGTLLDVGGVALDRSNTLEHSSSFDLYPTMGAEQALVKKRVWVRGGLDETTGTLGGSVKLGRFKIDVAYLYGIASARTRDVFGKRGTSVIMTLGFDYR
jgi:hypothetical protein